MALFEQLTAQEKYNYGVKIGSCFSKQNWENTLLNELSSKKQFKFGVSCSITGEIIVFPKLSLNIGAGYAQKGFKEDYADEKFKNENISLLNNNLTLHNLTGDIGIKFYPFNKINSIFTFTSLRNEFLIDYKDILFEQNGTQYGYHKKTVDDFNKYYLSGIIGIGWNINEFCYLNIEYNVSLTEISGSEYQKIKDKCIVLSLGITINLKKKH